MLQPGDLAPDFELPTDTGDLLRLSDLRGRKVIVYFYPAASTAGCTTQACDFRDNLASLQAAGYEVLGLSPDQPAKLARFRDAEGLTFPLLSDPGKEVLTAYGAYGEKSLYGKVVTGIVRSTFVIGPDGVVAAAMRGVNPEGHAEQVLAALP